MADMIGRCDAFWIETTELVVAAVTLLEGQFHITDRLRTHTHTHTNTHTSCEFTASCTDGWQYTRILQKAFNKKLEEWLMDFHVKSYDSV